MASVNRARLFGPDVRLATSTFDNLSLDASADRTAWVLSMPEVSTITHLGFRYGARTGTPPTYRISLQSVNTSGVPDGTVLGGGSPASATFTPPADTTWDGKWQWIALSNSYATTRGQILAIVIDYSSGTVDGSNNSSFTRINSMLGGVAPGPPYVVSDTTGSWAKINTATGAVYGLKSSATVYGFPMESYAATSLTTTGHRATKRFVLPSGMATTAQIIGMRLFGSPGTTTTGIFGLWDSAGTALAAIELDVDFSFNTNSRLWEVYFDDTPPVLAVGTTYYLGIELGGSTTADLQGLGIATANERLAFPLGTDTGLSTWNGSVWSDTNTILPFVEPIFADITAALGEASCQIGVI